MLPVKSISSVADKAYDFIRRRSTGEEKSLDLGFPKLNSALMDGLEWNRIVSIAALSGGGKSITLEQLKRNMLTLNKDQEFDVLSFDFEMPSNDQIARNVSGVLNKDLKWLYSVGDDGSRSQNDLHTIKQTINEIGKDPIYIVDRAGTVQEIRNTIVDFIVTRKLAINKRGLVITLDHTLLTKGRQGENEKAIVDHLSKMFVELKQECMDMGVKIIIIMLSQLNRDIESKDRVTNPLLHYPIKNDIFAASSVFYCSDYVLVSHKPSIVNGIDQFYGPPRNPQFPHGLPVYNPHDPTQAMVYWHLIKNRFGRNITIPMLDYFQYGKVKEYIHQSS